jgi:hypothetical protein
MARIRTIKPDFFKHENVAELPFEDRLAFIGIWTLADREGRLPDRPRRIAAELFPYDRQVDVEQILVRLDEGGFIVRYDADGDRFIAIAKFLKHQKPHMKEGQSIIPAPSMSRKRAVASTDPGSGEHLPRSVLAPIQAVASTDLGKTQTTPSTDLGKTQTPSSRVDLGMENGSGNGSGNGVRSRVQQEAAAPPADAGPPVPLASSSITPTSTPTPTAEDLQDLWNTTANAELPRWQEMPEPRRRAAKARLRERPLDGVGGWREVIARMSASAFCRGANDRGWRADPEFLLRPGTAAKVLEGKYDDRQNTGPPTRPRGPLPITDQDRESFRRDVGVQHEW